MLGSDVYEMSANTALSWPRHSFFVFPSLSLCFISRSLFFFFSLQLLHLPCCFLSVSLHLVLFFHPTHDILSHCFFSDMFVYLSFVPFPLFPPEVPHVLIQTVGSLKRSLLFHFVFFFIFCFYVVACGGVERCGWCGMASLLRIHTHAKHTALEICTIALFALLDWAIMAHRTRGVSCSFCSVKMFRIIADTFLGVSCLWLSCCCHTRCLLCLNHC